MASFAGRSPNPVGRGRSEAARDQPTDRVRATRGRGLYRIDEWPVLRASSSRPQKLFVQIICNETLGPIKYRHHLYPRRAKALLRTTFLAASLKEPSMLASVVR